MKQITFEQWEKTFVCSVAAADQDVCQSPDEFKFYDNGAVANSEGDFVIKCDEVRERGGK